MTWQDLKDDLDAIGEAEYADRPVFAVARRLLALWEPCDDCGGRGESGEDLFRADEDPFGKTDGRCSRCDDSGVIPNESIPEWFTYNGVWLLSAAALAAYLFGEGT